MDTKETTTNTVQQNSRTTGLSKLGKPGKALLCVLIIAVGVISANYLTRSSPKAEKQPPTKMTSLVRVQTIYPATQTVVVSAMGIVIPAREIILKSRVSGEIVDSHPEFIQGGIVRKGTKILRLDDTDYKLALAQKQSSLVNARYALKLEQGHQEVAKREWDLLKDDKQTDDDELALRKPHLEKVESDMAAAEANLEQAKLQLGRTQVYIPFNAIIRTKNVEIGSQVSLQDNLAELVGTDEYWIQVSIPVDRLQWISIPRSHKETGATARIVYRFDAERIGTVIKLLSDLETQGRMARLLIAVKDPLGLKIPHDQQPALLLGEYVRVEIKGKEIKDAYRIPRKALRDNTHIWIAGQDDKLEIRGVKTIWRDTDTVLAKNGLKPGDRLIVSDLSLPIAGMPLKIENKDNPVKPSTMKKP